jgi:RNA polymerase sigma factor (sigma-70 family)
VIKSYYARGQELHEGDADDRELALTELANARTFAELAAGLGAKTPRDAVASEAETTSEGETNQRLAFVACIEKLRMEKTAQATGFLRKRAPEIQDADLRNLIDAALMKACTRARSLDDSVGPLFWTVLKNGLADWYREVAVFERAAPKLTADCDSEPPQLDDLLGREQCDLLKQGMSQLSNEEKRLISLRFEEGKTYEEIAAQLNIKPGTARKRVDRILERLRNFFRERDALTLYWLWLHHGLWFYRPAIAPPARPGIA